MKANTWRWAVATMAWATVGLAGAVGCSSSSSGGGTSGGGDDASSYYGPAPSDGSADGEGGEGSVGDGGPDGPTCDIPAAATFSQATPGGGTAGCSPQVPNGQCNAVQYRLKCSADNPNYLPPPSDSACNFLPNNNDPTVFYYCCPCQQGAAPAGDP